MESNTIIFLIIKYATDCEGDDCNRKQIETEQEIKETIQKEKERKVESATSGFAKRTTEPKLQE